MVALTVHRFVSYCLGKSNKRKRTSVSNSCHECPRMESLGHDIGHDYSRTSHCGQCDRMLWLDRPGSCTYTSSDPHALKVGKHSFFKKKVMIASIVERGMDAEPAKEIDVYNRCLGEKVRACCHHWVVWPKVSKVIRYKWEHQVLLAIIAPELWGCDPFTSKVVGHISRPLVIHLICIYWAPSV